MPRVDGAVSGLGDSATRKNEITADSVAIFRNCVYNANRQTKSIAVGLFGENPFDMVIVDNTVEISAGCCIAYGYIGSSEPITLIFNITAAPQYWIIYAEFDCSVIPNTFAIKARNNQSSPKIGEYTLRQDTLSTFKTGVYQMPLAIVKVDGENLSFVSDERAFSTYPYKARSADEAKQITGTIGSNATIEGAIADNDKNVCSTGKAVSLIQSAVNTVL